MKKIIVMGANAARQKILRFDSLRYGEVNRALEMIEVSAGKGINFCRAVKIWGKAEPEVIQFAGGENGAYLANAMEKEGIASRTVRCQSPLRMCMTCIDERAGNATELIEPSGSADASECAEFIRLFDSALEGADGAALCGTLPGNTALELYYQVAELAVKRELPIQLDFYKGVEPLLDLPGAILKINREELGKITGIGEIVPALAKLFKLYKISLAAITDGPGNAYASDGKILASYNIPELTDIVSPIGCGDTASALFLSELFCGSDFVSAFRTALGGASANTESRIPAEFCPDRARELAALIKVECGTLNF